MNPVTDKTFASFINIFLRIIGFLIPLIGALSLFVFFWGIAKFILAAGDEKKLADGKQFMIWGVIAMFVMVSLWGIIAVVSRTFGFDFFIPQLPT